MGVSECGVWRSHPQHRHLDGLGDQQQLGRVRQRRLVRGLPQHLQRRRAVETCSVWRLLFRQGYKLLRDIGPEPIESRAQEEEGKKEDVVFGCAWVTIAGSSRVRPSRSRQRAGGESKGSVVLSYFQQCLAKVVWLERRRGWRGCTRGGVPQC